MFVNCIIEIEVYFMQRFIWCSVFISVWLFLSVFGFKPGIPDWVVSYTLPFLLGISILQIILKGVIDINKNKQNRKNDNNGGDNI